MFARQTGSGNAYRGQKVACAASHDFGNAVAEHARCCRVQGLEYSLQVEGDNPLDRVVHDRPQALPFLVKRAQHAIERA